eukprot:TRINITY_DN16768_c0_g1_i3.p1 TRINITY_DN16768_c0_g1~~TRINITY_DN16768_c0_g1_i3.p1  ORF type:complete len:792 (+),score=202.46 TRINITY_DN16768_c0_g1_i3:83-2377(+)
MPPRSAEPPQARSPARRPRPTRGGPAAGLPPVPYPPQPTQWGSRSAAAAEGTLECSLEHAGGESGSDYSEARTLSSGRASSRAASSLADELPVGASPLPPDGEAPAEPCDGAAAAGGMAESPQLRVRIPWDAVPIVLSFCGHDAMRKAAFLCQRVYSVVRSRPLLKAQLYGISLWSWKESRLPPGWSGAAPAAGNPAAAGGACGAVRRSASLPALHAAGPDGAGSPVRRHSCIQLQAAAAAEGCGAGGEDGYATASIATYWEGGLVVVGVQNALLLYDTRGTFLQKGKVRSRNPGMVLDRVSITGVATCGGLRQGSGQWYLAAALSDCTVSIFKAQMRSVQSLCNIFIADAPPQVCWHTSPALGALASPDTPDTTVVFTSGPRLYAGNMRRRTRAMHLGTLRCDVSTVASTTHGVLASLCDGSLALVVLRADGELPTAVYLQAPGPPAGLCTARWMWLTAHGPPGSCCALHPSCPLLATASGRELSLYYFLGHSRSWQLGALLTLPHEARALTLGHDRANHRELLLVVVGSGDTRRLLWCTVSSALTSFVFEDSDIADGASLSARMRAPELCGSVHDVHHPGGAATQLRLHFCDPVALDASGTHATATYTALLRVWPEGQSRVTAAQFCAPSPPLLRTVLEGIAESVPPLGALWPELAAAQQAPGAAEGGSAYTQGCRYPGYVDWKLFVTKAVRLVTFCMRVPRTYVSVNKILAGLEPEKTNRLIRDLCRLTELDPQYIAVCVGHVQQWLVINYCPQPEEERSH